MGSCIWNMLRHPITVEGLIQELLSKYDVTRAKCEEETLYFLSKLYEEGLIIVS